MKVPFYVGSIPNRARGALDKSLCLLITLIAGCFLHELNARPLGDDIDDITGKYHFLSADDTLAILEEEGKLKGYVDVYQGEEESDAILSYPITLGWRKTFRNAVIPSPSLVILSEAKNLSICRSG